MLCSSLAIFCVASVTIVCDATQYSIQFVDQINWSSERWWWLGAQAAYANDRRNGGSTYADIQGGSHGWERAIWDILPANELGTFYIQFVDQQNWSQERGWWLGAQAAYGTDRRNIGSTYVDIQGGNNGWERATWRLIPTFAPNHFFIQFVDQQNWSQERGWWLGAQAAYATDRRNGASTYVDIQGGNDEWARATWKLIPVHSTEELLVFEQSTGTNLKALVLPVLVAFGVLFGVVGTLRKRHVQSSEPLLDSA